MSLADRVYVARRFQRAVRIDTDFGDPDALEGFICPQTSIEVLRTMARHVSETGQGAFTWTGPYGSGKSSLVVALSALVCKDKALRQRAARLFGKEVTETVRAGLRGSAKGWELLAVVGRRDDPSRIIGEAIAAAGLGKAREWTGEKVVAALSQVAQKLAAKGSGLIVFIDEMGKFLEAAAQEGADIFFFQDLAEIASRSDGRLVVVGILHQAFEEYAHRLSREMRDEWAKIQGRFVDLAVNTAGVEQIGLLARAIESDHRPEKPGAAAITIAGIVHPRHPTEAAALADTVEACWPLHPAVACLLGPISRRRFGQNQRSLFGFLNAAEPQGFQDFIKREDDGAVYGPDRLWDYLRINLEPSILASPDGHRWALAAEAIERCETIGGDELHIKLLKTIAVVDLFKERSGLNATEALLDACVPDYGNKAIKKALVDLARWSLVIFRKYLGAYAIFEGSDFDIDGAVAEALEESMEIDFAALKSFAGLQPVVAKRHYHDTGGLRWFDVSLVAVSELAESADRQPASGAIGRFLFAFPTMGESEEFAAESCREAARQSRDWDVVVGLSRRAWGIVDLSRELLALEKVRNDHPELAGDAVARREVVARLSTLQAQLESELHRAFDGARWFRRYQRGAAKRYSHSELNGLASDLADKRFDASPRLHNELLCRQKPSSNAIAAQNGLLKRMVLNEGEPRLGIEGFPAEGGLFASLLEATGLYAETARGWRFCAPDAGADETYRLVPVWEAAERHLSEHADRPVAVSELYDLWRKEPFGVKDGLMPVLTTAFILAKRDRIAVYREGMFQAQFKELDVEYLARDAADIGLRWMDLTDLSRRLLSAMADVVRELDPDNDLTDLEPIDVARGLVAIHDRLSPWTKRTIRLSANAIKVRTLFRRASDPNKFLFDDIPAILERRDLDSETGVRETVAAIRGGLEELSRAYSSMLHRLQEMMLAELQVPNASPQSLAELRDRAENISQVPGDFRIKAFINRLAAFAGTAEDIEGIASLAASKPPQDWVDADVDTAAVEIAAAARAFIRLETFAHVKGLPDKRRAMAVVIGNGSRRTPVLEEFDIGDGDREAVEELMARVEEALAGSDMLRRNVILAALAEISARYMRTAPEGKNGGAKRKRAAV